MVRLGIMEPEHKQDNQDKLVQLVLRVNLLLLLVLFSLVV